MTKQKPSFWIKEWRQAHKLLSMQAMALAQVLLVTWATLPDDLKAVVPKNLLVYIAIGVIVLGMIGRIKSQPGKR